MRIRTLAVAVAVAAAAAACTRSIMTRTPHGIDPVRDFDVTRYMGKWYEIARLDHRFERGMTNVTATYSLNDDGTVQVVNRGLRDGERKSIQGTARFLDEPSVASLGVTFFPGFPGGYHVFALDPDYRWALVSGPNRGYFWILARQPQMDDATWQRLVGIAQDNGFDVNGLIRVDHTRR